MLLADVAPIVVPVFPTSGPLDLIFHQTWLAVQLGGFPAGGYKITLAGLIVVAIIGLAATAIAERLAGEKPGRSFITTLVLTIIGAYIFAAYVRLPFTDIEVEGVRLIAALLGAVVFSVFFVLIRRQTTSRPAAKGA